MAQRKVWKSKPCKRDLLKSIIRFPRIILSYRHSQMSLMLAKLELLRTLVRISKLEVMLSTILRSTIVTLIMLNRGPFLMSHMPVKLELPTILVKISKQEVVPFTSPRDNIMPELGLFLILQEMELKP